MLTLRGAPTTSRRVECASGARTPAFPVSRCSKIAVMTSVHAGVGCQVLGLKKGAHPLAGAEAGAGAGKTTGTGAGKALAELARVPSRGGSGGAL